MNYSIVGKFNMGKAFILKFVVPFQNCP